MKTDQGVKDHDGRTTGGRSAENPVTRAFAPIRSAFVGIALVSLLINMLMLTGPLFMLQVYDRVLASGSVPTLVVLGILALVLYLFFGFLDGLRSRTLARIAQRVDVRLTGLVYRMSNMLPVRLGRRAAQLRPVADLDTIRQFLSGPGPGLNPYFGPYFLFVGCPLFPL